MVKLTAEQAYQLAKAGHLVELFSGYISEHFTWGEVFTNCTPAEVKSAPQDTFANEVTQSGLLEQIRAFFDEPLHIHVWYRGPEHNARVGGATDSYHMKGLATDFHVGNRVTIAANRDVQVRLDPMPFMKKAGLEYTGGTWTHVDSRGYRARFSA